jgi:hypothetical protein
VTSRAWASAHSEALSLPGASRPESRFTTLSLGANVIKCFPSSLLSPTNKLECLFLARILVCGLYYKLMTIVNDDSRVVNKLEASLTDDARD